MTTVQKQTKSSSFTLVGSWINNEEYGTSVEYIVARARTGFVISAIDRFDDEKATIYDIFFDPVSLELSFKALWASTGRFMNIRLSAISASQISHTYSYTNKEMWFRKGAKLPTSGKMARNTLTGSWTNGDEYETDDEYIVSRAAASFAVRAIDRFDGEKGKVSKVRNTSDHLTLTFNVRWPSTGRLMTVRLLAISPNRIDYTYTHTQKEMWCRKGEPTVPIKS